MRGLEIHVGVLPDPLSSLSRRPREQPLPCQVPVSPLRRDPSLLQQDHPVSIGQHLRVVGYHEGGLPRPEIPEGCPDRPLRFGIQGRGELIKDQYGCVPEERPGNRDPLPVSHREGRSPLSSLPDQPAGESVVP